MTQQNDLFTSLLPIIFVMAIIYLLIFRPQKKKQKQHEEMIRGITRGDYVITAGGFWGQVRDVLDDSFIVEVADGVKMRILKSSISVKRDPNAAKTSAPKPKKDVTEENLKNDNAEVSTSEKEKESDNTTEG